MGKFKVCVYAICKNEEKFARRWMESMREADHVLALDTGSTDDTAELLTSLGASVPRREIAPWRFDTARNLSLSLVPEDADICVCTDLDESFVPGWREKLECAWEAGADQLRYRYVWNFLPDGSEGTVFYADKVHARRGFTWVNPVHEVLRWEGEGQPRRALAEGVQLEHRADPEKSRAQYLPLLELAVSEDPQNDRNMHYLGREYMFRGDWDQCIATLKRHLALPTATWRDERCASMRYIAFAYGQKGNRYDQERYLLRAAGEAPHLREGWLDLARFCYQVADWPGVMHYAGRALQITDRPRTYITEAASFGALPFDLLSVACWQLGLKERARSAVESALTLAPGDERLLENRMWIEKMP